MTESKAHRPRPSSLTRRVALASALAAALGGTIAATTSGVVAMRLVSTDDDAHLLAQADELADEVTDELQDNDDDGYEGHGTLAGALAHEMHDVDVPGARAAVTSRGVLLAGDPSLPLVDPGTCQRFTAQGRRLRVCAVRQADRTFLLAVDGSREQSHLALTSWGVLAGILFGALVAGAVSGLAARWALSPLETLRDRVRAIGTRDPTSAALGEPMTHVELEDLRASVAELVDRLAVALTSARGFAAEAAHELRTPLTKIGVELEMLMESTEPVETHTLARIRGQVRGLVALVQRLLVLASPHDATPATEAVDLGDVIHEALAELQEDARARVTADLSDDVLVRGDGTLLRALVSNALDNALKFSRGNVVVSASHDAHACVVSVVDDGPGIPDEERARVFGAFYRTAASRASGAMGHGVGLALIAHVAAAHGGTAEFMPTTAGAHLAVRLPKWA